MVIANLLARDVIFESLEFVGGHISPQNTEIGPQRPRVRCVANDHEIGLLFV